ncbi:MAG: bile acid:sodium symporter [Planctomycetes bacterium]|nr:bile acid:sodium symporter [Planctomycetota bacterium]
MDSTHSRMAACSHFLHRHFLWLLVVAYTLAAIAPSVGQGVCAAAGVTQVAGHKFRVSAPAMMLAFLLFGAGLAVQGKHLRDVFRRPITLAVGLTASLVVPVLVLLAASPLLAFWDDPEEVRDLIVGLAVVASMPVAGSSAGWSRAADGDCALSLGLVLLSTFLSPLTTPLVLQAAGALAPFDAGGDLAKLADSGGTGTFVTLWVVAPVLLGLLTRVSVGAVRADGVGPALKFAASLVLLVLCYANASTCLPSAMANPDWDFLALVVGAAGAMSGAGFVAGFGAARVVSADATRRASLVFGVGMANNGAGLALAAGALAGSPMALLPVVAVNLVQHLAAGAASWRLGRVRN